MTHLAGKRNSYGSGFVIKRSDHRLNPVNRLGFCAGSDGDTDTKMNRGRRVNMILALLVLLLWAGTSTGFSAPSESDTTKFEFLGQQLDHDYLTMDFKLPYGGIVEVRIFSSEGDLVWQNQYIQPRGENRIRLKAGAFETGNTYTVQLNYKTEEYKLLVERK